MSDTVTAAVKDSQAPFGALGERGLWPAFHRGVFECSSTKASTEIHNTKSEFGDSNQCTVGLFWCAPRCAPWHVRLAARLSPSAPDLTFCVLTCPPLDPRFPGAALAHPPLSALPPPPGPPPAPRCWCCACSPGIPSRSTCCVWQSRSGSSPTAPSQVRRGRRRRL